MTASGPFLGDLSWEELLQEINYLMKQETERLFINKKYYRQLFNSENPDLHKLDKMYERISNDQQRFDLLNELLTRLQTFNAFVVITAIDQCEQSEKKINGKVPDNFILHIRIENGKVTTSYFPLK